ncbi:hypothetical protein [Aurantiacibacter aquimixticola]|uniref:Envelope stress response membrane protein PspB n=1 Tax=Aurantiacibacter aquimixticola TaxID=1958945 RepID=A0A419RQP9_9SPHN|nr:hypothetical protein [Aurantiacibacter aquimixticola]RJY08090.1 hypothetical protein D6201_00800 [Aurantiacibacter aquimixticola]
MDFGGPAFVIAIIALSTVGWLVNNWIRAKHGYSLEDEWGGKTERADSAETRRLEEQNANLLETMEKMQDRMVVLERIVTDKGYTVAEEIEALRDTPRPRAEDSGIPLELNKKERA